MSVMTALATPLRARHLLKRLPAFSPVAIRLMTVVMNEKVSFQEVAKLFSLDPVLTGEVLRLANSGMYGRQYSVQSVLHAIAMLGLEKISHIAVTAALSNGFPRPVTPWIREWWRHSIAAALISDHVGLGIMDLDFGYTAGLLHGLGRLALYLQDPEDYPRMADLAHAQNADPLDYERQCYGANHAELTGFILSEWGLPEDLRLAVSTYHAPSMTDPLTVAVKAGCYYAESQGFGQCGCLLAEPPTNLGNSLDQFLLGALAIELNRIECSLI